MAKKSTCLFTDLPLLRGSGFDDAADEIERLRETERKLMDERDHLRAALEQARNVDKSTPSSTVTVEAMNVPRRSQSHTLVQNKLASAIRCIRSIAEMPAPIPHEVNRALCQEWLDGHC